MIERILGKDASSRAAQKACIVYRNVKLSERASMEDISEQTGQASGKKQQADNPEGAPGQGSMCTSAKANMERQGARQLNKNRNEPFQITPRMQSKR